ncbi:hypothetical protein BS50DRAFT_582238 [Corynespora cassiicola Philippines]|uniref:Uncharacterized protein n=1 Tax=Corynespora cassiicola Philippines TaxID=1448308 RepID=A0A2T2PD22_CORCC|nr:hypothetical protein BS50DRAFT_582238 [Corynespora cassiicola Philippines]
MYLRRGAWWFSTLEPNNNNQDSGDEDDASSNEDGQETEPTAHSDQNIAMPHFPLVTDDDSPELISAVEFLRLGDTRTPSATDLEAFGAQFPQAKAAYDKFIDTINTTKRIVRDHSYQGRVAEHYSNFQGVSVQNAKEYGIGIFKSSLLRDLPEQMQQTRDDHLALEVQYKDLTNKEHAARCFNNEQAWKRVIVNIEKRLKLGMECIDGIEIIMTRARSEFAAAAENLPSDYRS